MKMVKSTTAKKWVQSISITDLEGNLNQWLDIRMPAHIKSGYMCKFSICLIKVSTLFFLFLFVFLISTASLERAPLLLLALFLFSSGLFV